MPKLTKLGVNKMHKKIITKSRIVFITTDKQEFSGSGSERAADSHQTTLDELAKNKEFRDFLSDLFDIRTPEKVNIFSKQVEKKMKLRIFDFMSIVYRAAKFIGKEKWLKIHDHLWGNTNQNEEK